MSKPEIRNVVILGAGRLAVNLSMAIRKNGYTVVEVYNRTESKGKELARKLKATYVEDPEKLTQDAGLYILAVSDAAIPALLGRLRTGNRLIVHTSGAVDMEVLRQVSTNFGVIYPPQTFSADSKLRFRNVPLCIEASSAANLRLLKDFAGTLSEKVYLINSRQRKILHLSAVFASNFTNFMMAISEELLLENGMDFGILEPIIRQTADNASSGDVFKMQTGPAVREDLETIRTHLELLSAHPDYKEIYDLITRNIIKRKIKP
ncbi:MAG: DUF2520 domain-containing protein [Bacteroidetes bacterium]|nr:DUF2520 domain-containing protein [Bacteroidota bacterium]